MGKTAANMDMLPEAIIVRPEGRELDELLDREWLLTNQIGAYASSTVLGCNTRRYHGLLVAATAPPVGRIVALATVMEQVVIGDAVYELATNEFPDAFAPRGMVHLVEFRNDVAATFVFRLGEVELIKRVILAAGRNAVAIQYALGGSAAANCEEVTLHLRPFAAMRDFHAVRQADRPHQMTFAAADGAVVVQDRSDPHHSLYLSGQQALFRGDPEWWNRFVYRADHARGHEELEDLYSPGTFTYRLTVDRPGQLDASLTGPEVLDFDSTMRRRRERLAGLAHALPPDADEMTRRLAVATNAFVVKRRMASGTSAATILAGYHWFADWGRDAFIALPGLLLSTARLDMAEQVFSTFAERICDGMIPNRFDDYSATVHYNSIDASLWFIIAAERYLVAGGKARFWRDVLMPAAAKILQAYQAGTLFDIHADADELLTGGSPGTQLTWMDAKLGNEVITPRHGKAVEINALWYAAHEIMASRALDVDRDMADHSRTQAELIGSEFVRTFWNDQGGYLYDCVRDGEVDFSIRPNQIFAVSLPYSPLSPQQQAGVLSVVTEKLLTPYGLRTLAPDDPRYRGEYGRSIEARDRAYHQGTVWAWLIGPYVEAYLKVNGYGRDALDHAESLLSAFDRHIYADGMGQVSEIFDGQPPHRAGGCIAQAWSVAEILRAKRLIAQCRQRL